MSFTRGGRADKFGNHYESMWVAARFFDLLNERLRSVMVEAIGDMERGTDLWVEDFEGNFFAEQCKARHGSNDKWTVFALKDVIKELPSHVTSRKSKSFRVISPVPFSLLCDLCDDARNSESSEDYILGIVNKAEEKRTCYSEFCNVLGLDSKIVKDRETAYQCLKHFKIEPFVGMDESLDTLRFKTSLLLSGNPDTAISLLRNFVIDCDMLGKRIFSQDILRYLEAHGIRQKKGLGDERLEGKFRALNEEFCNSISGHLIQGKLINREETTKCLAAFESFDVIIVHGEAGKGKSGVLFELIQGLENANVPILALRLDRKIPEGSASSYGKQIGLPDSPSICLAKYVGTRMGVLILDQLDALRWTGPKSQDGISICKQMVNDVLKYNMYEGGQIKVVLTCRSYDLENDPEIKGWLSHNQSKNQFLKVEISSLSDSLLQKLIGDQFNALSPSQLKILSIPQNLFMWFDIKDHDAATFDSSVDLMKRFWKYKRGQIEQIGIKSDDINKILDKLVGYLERKGTVSAPDRIIDDLSAECLNALLSHGVLQRNNDRIMFCHQSYLDYLVARNVFVSIENGSSILSWLGPSSQQTLNRRQALSLYLLMQLSEDSDSFASIAEQILEDASVRYHIKHLVLEVWGQVRVISPSALKLFEKLLGNSPWTDAIFRTSVIGNPTLAKYLFASEIPYQYMRSTNTALRDHALWLVNSVIKELPDEALSFLMKTYEESLLDKNRAFQTLGYRISEDTTAAFEFRIKLIKDGAEVHFVDWQLLSQSRPEYAVRLIKLLASLQAKVKARASGDGYRLYSPDLLALTASAREHSHLFWDNLINVASDQLKKNSLKRKVSKYDTFDIEELLQGKKHEIDDFSELAVLLCVDAGKELAASEPVYIKDFFAKNRSDIFVSDDILSVIFGGFSKTSADYVIQWLLEDTKRFGIGLSFQRPKWMLAADLVEKFSPHCAEKNFKNLEEMLYRFTPSGTSDIEKFSYRLQSNKRGWFFPAWGEAQYFLVPKLASDRTSIKTKSLLSELKRKFDSYPRRRFYSGFEASGGFVGSKLDPNIHKISDKSWLRILEDNNTPKQHSHSSWKQVNENTIHVSSHETFSSSLERAAKFNPQKFCSVFDKVKLPIDDSYVSSMLRVFALTKPEAGGENPGEAWQKVDMVNMEKFWLRFRDRRDEVNIARSFCWLIKSRSDEVWPATLIQDLQQLALTHENPKLGELAVSSQDGDGLVDSDKLYMTTINSVRGSAIQAMGALLWKNKELAFAFDSSLKQLVEDKHPAVLMAMVSVALPLLNIDKDKAISLFSAICHNDLRVACIHNSISFFNHCASYESPRLYSIMQAMLDSKIEEAVQLSSEMITYYSQSYGEPYLADLPKLLRGNVPQRKGAARALKNLVRENLHGNGPRNLIEEFFNDEDESVRQMASKLYRQDEFLNTQENIPLTLKYIGSRAFEGSENYFFYTLEKYQGDVVRFKDLILSGCSRYLDSPEALAAGYQRHYDDKLVSGLLIRLFEQSFSDKDLQNRCLDMWDKFFEKNVGRARELTNLLNK